MILNNLFKIFILHLFFLNIVLSSCFQSVYQYKEPNLNLTCQDLYSKNEHFQLVYINHIPTFLLSKDSSNPIVEENQIIRILDEAVVVESNFSSALNTVKNSLDELALAKNAAEQKCLQYTGIDRYDCYDKDSCLLAAFSVPQASIAVNSPGFIEAMIDFNKKRKNLTQKILELNSLLSVAEANAKNAEQILNAMDNLEKEILAYNTCPLMLDQTDQQCFITPNICFEYCPKIFIKSSFYDSKEKLYNSKKILEKLDNNKNLAKNISLNTYLWLDFLKKRTTMWDNTKSDILKLLNSINSSINSKKLNDIEIKNSFNNSIAEFEQITQIINEGNFFIGLDRAKKLLTSLEQLNQKLQELEKKLEQIDKKLKVIEISLNELKSSSDYEELNNKFKELKEKYSLVEIKNLEEFLKEVSDFEKEVLSKVALKKLNIDKEKKENYSGLESINISSPQIMNVKPQFSCPFSIAFFALLIFFIFKNSNT